MTKMLTLAGEIKGVQWKSDALIFTHQITQDEWMGIGKTFTVIEHGRMWWFGDWINYGEARFGEKYSQALELDVYTEGTLRNACYVCGRFAPERRNPKLSFSHHAAVAKLPPSKADKLLDRAFKEGLTVIELQALVNPGDEESPRADSKDFGKWWDGYVALNKFVPSKREQKIARDAWHAGRE